MTIPALRWRETDKEYTLAPRPADTVVISTRLPEGMPERIDKIAGPGNRAAFIREAIVRRVLEYEGNPAAYALETMPEKPADKWDELILRWHKDHQAQQVELEAVKHKLDALADIIVLQLSPGAGKGKFKNALALEFKKHFGEKLTPKVHHQLTGDDDK